MIFSEFYIKKNIRDYIIIILRYEYIFITWGNWIFNFLFFTRFIVYLTVCICMIKCFNNILWRQNNDLIKNKIEIFIHVFFFQKPIGALEKRTKCCLCCKSNRVVLQCLLERSAYVCGEALRLKANIKNQNEKDIRLIVRVIQVKLFQIQDNHTFFFYEWAISVNYKYLIIIVCHNY